MSVFEGGASLDAIETVCAGAEEKSELILETLAGLVGKSLIMREDRLGAPHFVMLESIRDFAREELGRTGVAQSVFDAHVRYFLSCAERLKPLLGGATLKSTLDRFEACHENFQAAIDRLHKKGQTEDEVRLCVALGAYWRVRGYLSIGLQCVTLAIANTAEAPSVLRADALAELGAIELEQGNYASGVGHLKTALDFHRDAQNCDRALFCATCLGELSRLRGDMKEAREYFLQVSKTPNAEGSLHVANARMGLGLIDWQEGNIGNARIAFEDVLATARSLGEASLQAKAAGNLGMLFLGEGNMESALAGFLEARKIHEELGDAETTLVANNNLGVLYLRRGDWVEAIECFEAVRQLAIGIGNDRWHSLALCGLSDAWRQKNEYAKALESALKARDTAMRLESGLELGLSERVLGDALLASGLAEEARDGYARAIRILESSHEKEDLVLARIGHQAAVHMLSQKAE
jgi:non-specific serine/threonine protein kinase